MLKRKNGSNQRQRVRIVGNRRRLRYILIQAAARFRTINPQWNDYFFEMGFLLNHGLPIVERHLAAATTSSAIDLALAWAEEWPLMTTSQRKACLQAQTVIAAELLRLVTEAIMRPRPTLLDSVQTHAVSWRGMVGVPLAYVQAQNPPTRNVASYSEGKL